jgi:hypothetical protein
MIYTFFEYELWVVGELQAFGALELALKPRLATIGVPTSGTMRTRIDRARKHGLMPPAKPGGSPWDSGEALIQMRNELSHGSFDVHTPAMALTVLRSCADQISSLYG